MVDKPFETIDVALIPSFIGGWTYGEDRYLKPFKLLDYQMTDTSIKLKLESIRKSKKHDEIKLLLIDVISVLKLSNYKVGNVNVGPFN
jgi:hypothetical protein